MDFENNNESRAERTESAESRLSAEIWSTEASNSSRGQRSAQLPKELEFTPLWGTNTQTPRALNANEPEVQLGRPESTDCKAPTSSIDGLSGRPEARGSRSQPSSDEQTQPPPADRPARRPEERGAQSQPSSDEQSQPAPANRPAGRPEERGAQSQPAPDEQSHQSSADRPAGRRELIREAVR